MSEKGLLVRFQCGIHACWHLVVNNGTGAATLTDMEASFAFVPGGGVRLFIAAPSSGPSVWVRVVEEA